MPFAAVLPALIGTAAVGGALAGRKSARTQTQSNTYSNQPTIPSETRPVFDALQSQFLQRLQQPSGLPSGYIPSAIAQINQNTNASEQGLMNRLTTQGLAGSPIAGNALGNLFQNRNAQLGQLTTLQAPLLARQFRQEDYDHALNLFRSVGTGQQGQGQGQTVFPGSPLGGAFGSVGSILGLLSAMGMLGKGLGGK